MINRQICQGVVAEIKYKLSCIEISKANENDAKTSLQAGLDSIHYDEIKQEKESVFKRALNNKDYKEVLRIFNEKGTAAEVGKLLNVENSGYQRKVINLLISECHDELAAAMRVYLPNEIPERIESVA